MKKIYLILIMFSFNSMSVNAEEIKCNTALNKLKPACNIGKAFDKLKDFSKKHQTINQSVNSNKKKIPNTLSKMLKEKKIQQKNDDKNGLNAKLKKYNKENKTLLDIYNNKIK